MSETLRWMLFFVCAPLALLLAGMALHALWPIGLISIGGAAGLLAAIAILIAWLTP